MLHQMSERHDSTRTPVAGKSILPAYRYPKFALGRSIFGLR
jgi:hypothetical protein